MKNLNVPALVAVGALTMVLSVGAQAQMAGHQMGGAATAAPATDMKAECQAMMAKKQEMQAKQQAMDVRLDKLVAEMNAAKSSKEMEKPMAAVLNELVAQRKAFRSAMMEMQPEMMAHMMRHMEMQGMKGSMGCPMMSMDHHSMPGGKQPKK